MDTGLLVSDNIYDAESGRFISATQQRAAELVAEYNDELRVVWIPTEERTIASPKPFGVAHFPRDKEPYVIFFLTEAEMMNPELVMEKLIQGDQGRGSANSLIARLEAAEAARILTREKETRDMMEEMHDRAHSMFKSPLHTYNLGGGRKFNT